MSLAFRQAMTLLHSWAGLLLGSVLFAIFWMGSLSVFDREIDRWMKPDTRVEAIHDYDLNALAASFVDILPQETTYWRIFLPTPREPVARMNYRGRQGQVGVREILPASGTLLPDQGTKAATGFIFPFHFSLHLRWKSLGYWLVGLAGMMMLLLLVSGVVIHRRLLIELFTFRPRKSLQRSSLDLHNLSGVLGLPFHALMTLSGLVIFAAIYFPDAHVGADAPDQASRYFLESTGSYSRKPLGQPGSLGDLKRMREQARHVWQGDEPYMLRVWYPGDANSYVEMRRSHAGQMRMNLDQLYFDGQSGEILKQFEAAPIKRFQRLLTGLHFIQFDHWPLRFLYFIAGLLGCLMIGSGFVIWLQARKRRQATASWRLVEALSVASMPGIVLATVAFLGVNRVLPLGIELLGQSRAGLEMFAFYAVWLASFAHAYVRGPRAWSEQLLAVACGALLAVGLNALSTGDHVLQSWGQGQFAVAGVDLGLGVLAALAAFIGFGIRRSVG